ncbi:flagellar hook-associated protein FlgK [Accumulibacter sp.]|uniref:flagellar hook-associated protein FlgK n=1 Tax=Accumulibacter sp. TaxID=2053492 RepID=UPI002589429F|nr:flagellar hook-associated protein FlgK [Accumulibacter sp.]
MGSGIIGVGLSALQAAQFGLQTTEHNIANVNTPGFSRQRTIQASNFAQQTGSGFFGQGTHVVTVERMYSRFLNDQVNRSQSSTSQLDSYAAQINQINNLLADPTTGLSPALQGFFTSVQEVAANPSQLASRQIMIANAQTLSTRYQSMGDQLAQMYDGVNGQIEATVTSINANIKQIALLNQQIPVSQAATGQPANDLLDTRDQLVLELNKLIKARTTTNSDGSYNVFIGSGQQLVAGSITMDLATMRSPSDPSRRVVGQESVTGDHEIPESLLSGGSLGGLLAFRSESLDQASNELGRNAASLALTFNAQSALGQDLLGQSQISPAPPALSSFTPDLFLVSPPKVIANTNNPPGSPTVSATFVNPPPFNGNFYTDLGSSDYRLSADASGVTLTRLSDNKQWSGTDLGVLNTNLASDPQGFTLDPSPTLLEGSSYLIQPTRDAARKLTVNPAVVADASLITAAGPIRTSTGATNTGLAKVSAGSVAAGYATAVAGMPMSLVYQGGNLQNFPVGAQVSINGAAPVVIAASTDVVPYTSGATIAFLDPLTSTPGFSFTLTGVPNNGDTFSIARNSGALADGRNALVLAQLQTQQTMSGKSSSFQEAYAQLVSQTGSKTNQIQVSGAAQQALLTQAQNNRESLSGVNLEEEAANLILYQQAYQAAAKALQIGSSLFETILQMAA